MNQTNMTKRSDIHRKNKNGKGMLLKSVVVIILLALVGTLGYGAKMLTDTKKVLNSSYRPRISSKTNKTLPTVNPLKQPISVLILGVDDNDERGLGSARTDTMILLTFDSQKSEVSMVSIPRDTNTQITSDEFVGMDKINTAYTYGKEESSIKAVEDLMDIPVNYYATVDFQAFVEVIDALNGIEVDVPMDINESYASDNSGKTIVPKGLQTLDGEKALAFARIRKIDNDIERGKRQQIVIEKTIQKAVSSDLLFNYKDLLNAVDGHFWTDMPSDIMFSIAQHSLNKKFSFNSYAFDWDSYDDPETGASMVVLFDDSLNYISHKLRVSLGLDEEDERDEEGYEFQTNGIISPKNDPYGNSYGYEQTNNYYDDNSEDGW